MSGLSLGPASNHMCVRATLPQPCPAGNECCQHECQQSLPSHSRHCSDHVSYAYTRLSEYVQSSCEAFVGGHSFHAEELMSAIPWAVYALAARAAYLSSAACHVSAQHVVHPGVSNQFVHQPLESQVSTP